MAKIKLQNVRLSFPSLFKRASFEGKEGKYEATLLIEKGSDQAKMLSVAIREKIQESGLKIPKERWCLKDGDDSEYDGYEGMLSLKAANNKRPTIVDKDKSPLAEDDDVVYAGCYVNAIVDFWVQNNQYGKRINANLYGVQFFKDGEPFGQGPVDVTDDFDDVSDGDDAPWDDEDDF